MRMQRHHVASVLLISLFIGCSCPFAPTQSHLDSSIDGGTFAASPNDNFSLCLNLNADGGYQWYYNIGDSTVVTTDAQPTFQAPENLVGGVPLRPSTSVF